MLSLAGGFAFIGVSALLVWKVVPAGTAAKPVASGFVVGLGLLVKGGVELVLDKRWSEHTEKETKVLQVLGFLALVAIAVGIAYYGVKVE